MRIKTVRPVKPAIMDTYWVNKAVWYRNRLFNINIDFVILIRLGNDVHYKQFDLVIIKLAVI